MQRIQRRRMEIDAQRLAGVTAQVDTSEPQYMHHLGHNPKKDLALAERQHEIDSVSIQPA